MSTISSAYWVIFYAFLSSVEFFQIQLFMKLLQEYLQCQTVWIPIRPDIMSGLIWVQSDCKCYEQTTLVGNELNGHLSQDNLKIIRSYFNLLNSTEKFQEVHELTQWIQLMFFSLSPWQFGISYSFYLSLVVLSFLP